MALSLSACSKGDPSGATSVYVTIDNGQGLFAPDELLVTVLGDGGPLFQDQRLPATGSLVPPAGGGSLLGTVTLYVDGSASPVDVQVRGYLAGVLQSQGTTHVIVVAGKQVAATVVLAGATEEDDGRDVVSDAEVISGSDVASGSDAGETEETGDAANTAEAGDAAETTDAAKTTDAADAADGPAQADVGVAPGADAAPPDRGASDGGAAPSDGKGSEAAATDAGGDGGGCTGSALSGLAAVPPNPVDLTAEGVLDWRHWGANSFVDFKSTAGNLISDYTLIGNGTTSTVTRSGLTFNWTDGSPRTSVTGAPMAIAVLGVGSGFEISAPAAATSRTLAIYVSGDNSDTAVLTASLSDGCVANYTMTRTDTQVYVAVHRIAFRSALPGTLLRVTWTMTAGTAPIGFHAATLY